MGGLHGAPRGGAQRSLLTLARMVGGGGWGGVGGGGGGGGGVGWGDYFSSSISQTILLLHNTNYTRFSAVSGH